MTTSSKKCKIPYLWTFSAQIGQKWIFHKNSATLLCSIYSSLTSSKKSGKTSEPIPRNILNYWTDGETDGGANQWVDGRRK